MLVTKGKQRRLQSKSWTCSVNDVKKLNLLRNKLQMAVSVAGFYRMGRYDAQAKNRAKRETKKSLSPAASAKLAEKKVTSQILPMQRSRKSFMLTILTTFL